MVAIAQAWLAAGDPQRALDLLATRRDEAYRSGRDQATGIALDRATAAIARRLRLHDPYRSVIDRLAASADPDEVALAAPVVALTEGTLDDPQLGLAATAPSLWWRVQVPLRPEARARIAEIATRAWASLPEPPYEPRPASEVALAFDAFEGGGVFAGSPGRPATSPRSLAFTPEFWGAAHPGEPEAAARLAVRAAMLGVATIAVSPIAVPEPSLRWVESVPTLVGRRRAAELAFEEAELLALRLPMESRQALDQAARWFEQAGDLTGALFARTRSAIAAAHAGFDAAREPARRELREAFDAVRAARPAILPSFDDLLQAARSSDAGGLPGAGGSPWTPWLQRISVAAAWAAGVPGDPAPALVLPEGAWPMLRRFGQAAAFLGVVYVALYLVQWLATGSTPAWYGPIVTGFVFFVAIGVITLVFRSAGTGLRASAVLAAHVGIDASAPSGDDGAPSVSLRVEAPDFRDGGTLAEPTATGLLASALVLPWEAVFGRRIAYRRVASFADGPLGPVGDTYRTAASAIPDQVGASVRDLAARTGGVPLPVAIRPAPGLVELPWEAMVALAAESGSDDRAGGAVVPYREAGLVSGPRRGGRRTTIQVAAGVGWQSLSAAWNRTGFTRLLELAEVHPGSAILHLVGRPVVGEGEIVLQLDLGSAVSKGATVESQARGDGAIRLGSIDLSSVALVLIQAEPEAAEERQQSDRRKAERLRAWPRTRSPRRRRRSWSSRRSRPRWPRPSSSSSPPGSDPSRDWGTPWNGSRAWSRPAATRRRTAAHA